jgi:hypothetical protein
MQDGFEIPVIYNNEELTFKAHAVRFGYVHHIVVDVNGTPVTIERDEEGNYRALGELQEMHNNKMDIGLVKAIVDVLENI